MSSFHLLDADLGALQNRPEFTALWKRTGEVKLPAILEYIADLLDSGHKMLIFAHHQSIMDALRDQMVALKTPYIRIDGHTPTIPDNNYVIHFNQIVSLELLY